MKISVVLSIRNGEKYMTFLNNVFDKIEETYKNFECNIDFEYFIYENNSTDNTKEEIKTFYKNKNRKGKYLLEDIENNTIKTGINFERGLHMANIRNKLKVFHGQLDSNYVLLFDCDVIFTANTITELINTFNDKISMVTPFGICWDKLINYNCIHYYDSLAVISKDNLSFKEHYNTCLFNTCKLCINIRNQLNIKIDEQYLFNTNQLIEVKSAFGSISLIKTHVYNNVKWEPTICEHHSFCEQVNKYGSVVINPQIKTITSIPKLNNYYEIEEELINIENFLQNK